MIDNHRFVDAYFVNNEKTILKTEWLDESGTIIRPYIIEVDKDPDVYKKFMKTKDLELMERRFKGFVGVGADDIPLIESGIGRLGIPKEIHVPTILEKKNKDTFKQAAKREALKQKWHLLPLIHRQRSYYVQFRAEHRQVCQIFRGRSQQFLPRDRRQHKTHAVRPRSVVSTFSS